MASQRRRARKPLSLTDSPLVLVLAQVRIGPVLKMESYVPDLQEQYRSAGYPRFGRETTKTVQFGGSPEPQFGETTRWIFKDVNGSQAIVITQNFLVLETRSYENFEAFTDLLQDALEIFVSTSNATVVERLGLRYVNLITDSVDKGLSFYLQPGMLGLDADRLGLERRLHRVEVVGTTNRNSHLVVRVSQNDQGQHLPPDLLETALEYEEAAAGPSSFLTLLDLDHFQTETHELSIDEIIDRFWDLHNETDLAFRAAVTDEALIEWGHAEGEQ